MNQNNYHTDQIFGPGKEVDKQELIDYAAGKLAGEAANEVEQRALEDDFTRDALEGVEMVGAEKFEAMLNKIEARIADQTSKTEATPVRPLNSKPNHKSGRRINFKAFYGIAASLLVLAVVALFVFPGKTTPGDIADGAYETYAPPVVRSGQTGGENIGVNQYQNGDYADAAKNLDQFSTMRASFLAGNAYYEIGKYEEAVARYDKVIQNGDDYYYDANWYKAITLLKLERVDEAKSLFESIKGDTLSPYAEDSGKVLGDLMDL